MRQWPTRLSEIFQALQYRNYRLFFFGQAISLTGLWMTRTATQWLVYRMTESAWMLGVAGFCQLAPAFLLSPLAGTLVDRWNRHTVLLVAQVGSMLASLALAVLTLAGVIEVWQVLLLCAAEGAVRGFGIPARQALVVQLVDDRDSLPNAIALNSTIFNVARMIGPALGGLIVAFMGEGMCFLIDGVSYLAVIAALMAMQLPNLELNRTGKSVLRDMGDGFIHTFGYAPYRALLLSAGVVVLAGGASHMALMSEFAKKILGGDATTLGILMSASGCGALLGAFYLATRRTVRGLGKVIASCFIMFGLLLVAFAMSRSLWLASTMLVLSGFAFMTAMAGSNTIMQTLVEDDKRGRVMAMWVMMFTGAAPTGQLLAGAVAEQIGTPWTIVIGGSVCVVAGLNLAIQLPALRAIARPVYIERGIIAEQDEAVEPASR